MTRPIPGGRGPQSPLKFVVKTGPFPSGTDTTTVLRQPLFSPGPRQPPQQGFIVPNLLVTTLAVVALAPFIPVDLAAPRAPVPVRSDAPPNLLSTTLAPRPPFSQTDWSIAKTKQFVAQFDPPNVTINLAAPFIPVDWTAPVRPAARATDLPPNVTIGLPVAVQAPFLPVDFTASRASVRAITFDAPSLLLTAFAPIAPQPFFPLDWQPQRAKTLVSDAPYQANIALLTAPPPVMPFGQYDWQMPIQQPKPADHSWIPDLLNTTLVPGASPVVVTPPPPGVGKGKRRRILPDGQVVYATDYETAVLLRQFRQQKLIEAKNDIKPTFIVKPSKPIVLPEALFEDTNQREEEEFILLIHESTRRSH